MVNRAVLTLLVLTVGVQMLILYRQQNSAPTPAAASTRPDAVESIAARGLTVSVQNAPRLGNGGARLAIVEFADFECPFCRRHATSVLPALKRRFVDTGIATYYYLHLPLEMHPHARDAAYAAECARAQGRFWDLHGLLFAGTVPRSLTPDSLRKLSSSLAIDVNAFDTCLEGVADRIAEDVAQASRLDIVSTPHFLLGKAAKGGTITLLTRINGAQPLDVFVKAIADLDRRASVASAPLPAHRQGPPPA